MQQHSEPLEQTPSSTLRLDATMQREVLQRAAQLQQHHDATLSAQELEAAAVEIGLDPVFVRQAIAQITAEAEQEVMTSTQSETRSIGRLRPRRRLLTPPAEWAVSSFGLVLGVLCGVGRTFGAIPLAYGGFVIALALGLLLWRPAKAFSIGIAVYAGEMAAAKLLSSIVHQSIHISAWEFVCYPAIAGVIALVGALIQYVVSRASTRTKKHRK